MEGIKKVDEKNMNKIYRSDGQTDWMNWRNSQSGKRHLDATNLQTGYKKSRHAPAFPKLGMRTNTHVSDNSNYEVGLHTDVLAPKELAISRGGNYLEKQHLAREEAAEREYRLSKQNELQSKKDDEESVMLPPGWVELYEPETNKLYFFNQRTGETSYDRSRFDVKTQDTRSIPHCESFIPSDHFNGTRSGYFFSVGDEGLGYYKDPTDDSNVSKSSTNLSFIPSDNFTGSRENYYFSSGALGLGYYLNGVVFASAGVRTDSNEQKKPAEADDEVPEMTKREQLSQQMMEVATRALSSYANLERQRESGTLSGVQSIPIQNPNPSVKQDPTAIWKIVKDPLSRRTFYLNSVTNERSTTKPY